MRMALKNIWARKQSSIKVMLSMTIMITILCIFVTYSIALNDKTQELVFGYRSGHYYATTTQEPLSEVVEGNLKSIKNTNYLAQYDVYSPAYQVYGIDFRYKVDNPSGDDEELTPDGYHELRCYHSEYRDGRIPANASDLEIVFHRGNIAFVEDKDALISPNDSKEANYRWSNDNYVQQGSMDISNGGILLSTEFLREFNLSNDIVGKELQLRVSGTEYTTVVVEGILNKHYFALTGNVEMPQIVLSKGGKIYSQLQLSSGMMHVTELHVTDYMSARVVANEIVAVAGISDFKTGSSYGLAMASTVTLVNMVLVGVMSTVGFGIAVALLLNIMFSTQFMITKKANYYGMIRAYGATRSKVFRIMFFEILILATISILIAYGLSYGLAFLLQFALSSMLGIGVEFTPLNFGMTFVSAIVSSIILLLVVTLINYNTAIRSNVVHLLRRSIEG